MKMTRKRAIVMAMGVIAVAILFLVIWQSGHIRLLEVRDQRSAVVSNESMDLIEMAAQSDNDQTAKTYLQKVTKKRGISVTSQSINALENAYQKRRLYLLLAEMAPDKTWKDKCLANAKAVTGTPMGDFDYQ